MQSEEALQDFLGLIFGMMMMYALFPPIAQVITFMKDGVWVPLPAIDIFLPPDRIPGILDPHKVLLAMPFDGSWLSSPQDWLGVHRIVTWILSHIHASILLAVFIFSGYVVTMAAVAVTAEKLRGAAHSIRANSHAKEK